MKHVYSGNQSIGMNSNEAHELANNLRRETIKPHQTEERIKRVALKHQEMDNNVDIIQLKDAMKRIRQR